MDPLTQIRLTRELIDIDSTTGREAAAGTWIADTLERLGWTVVRQPVVADRFNVYAHAGNPVVVLSTHYDCVPPFFASRDSAGRLHGRGSSDAKGTLVAEIAAAERLRAAGESRVGLLFVVGEERGSEGAMAANALAPGSRFLVNGEPTDNRLASATRGVYRARLRATGRAAHSSRPDLGESAIEGFTVNKKNITEALDRNPILITALNAVIGYEAGAAIAKKAYAEGKALIDVALADPTVQKKGLKKDDLLKLLNPADLTTGGIKGPGGAGG